MVRSLLGGVLLAAAGVLLVIGLLLAVFRRRNTKRLDAPARVMTVVSIPMEDVPYGLVDLPGRIDSPPTVRAPVSGQLCSLWELTLFELTIDNGPHREPVWVIGRSGDLTVSWEGSRERRPDQSRREAGPGSVNIPGHFVHVVFPPPPEKPIPVLTYAGPGLVPVGDVRVLEELGLPPDLAARVRADPAKFQVAEGTVSTGGFLRLNQRPLNPPRSLPDPEQPFQVYGLSSEALVATGTGCLTPVVIGAAIVLGFIGLALLTRA